VKVQPELIIVECLWQTLRLMQAARARRVSTLAPTVPATYVFRSKHGTVDLGSLGAGVRRFLVFTGAHRSLQMS
jgi:hypothetical protein